MPYIIILTGHPCSGKTTLANMIRDRALQTQTQYIDNVVLVNETMANPTVIDPKDIAPMCYTSSTTEKILRGSLKSVFDRTVSAAVHDEAAAAAGNKDGQQKKKTLIVLDSTNYIKGYRYELYCISKAAGATYCVVWCLNDIGTVKEWNRIRQQRERQQHQENETETTKNATSSTYYSDEILNALILRYEPPDDRNRWDQPLYRIDVRSSSLCSMEESQQEQLEQQQQQQQHHHSIQKDENTMAQELLQQSLYNMHNLSEAISSSSLPAELAPETSTTNPSVSAPPLAGVVVNNNRNSKGKSTSAFKRSAFQKKVTTPVTTTATTDTIATPTTTMNRPITLTAEALSSLNSHHHMNDNTDTDMNNSMTELSSHDTKTMKVQQQKMKPTQKQQQRQQRKTRSTATTSTLIEQVDEFLSSFVQNVVPLKEGTSTRQHQSIDTDILHIADTITQQLCTVIIDTIINTQTNPKTTIINSANDGDDNNHDDRMEISFMNQKWYFKCINDQRQSIITTDKLRHIRTNYIQWIRKNPIQDLIQRPQQQQTSKTAAVVDSTTTTFKVVESFLLFLSTQTQTSTQ